MVVYKSAKFCFIITKLHISIDSQPTDVHYVIKKLYWLTISFYAKQQKKRMKQSPSLYGSDKMP